MFKVGDLARRSGLTVRTLHHYDHIGLLVPSARSDGGYRLYSDEDVRKLAQIQSLKQLELSLAEIQDVLADPEHPLEQTLALHAQQLEAQIQQKQRLLRSIQRAISQLAAREGVATAQWLQLMEELAMVEKYYTPEQLEYLEHRRQQVGEDRIQQVQREWTELFAQFGEALERGAAPGSDEVQALVQKADALILEFTGGDPGVFASLEKMYQEEDPKDILEPKGMHVDPKIMEFMARARGAKHP